MEGGEGIGGVGVAVLLGIGFVLALLFAVLCRGLAKPTELNPNMLAFLAFMFSVVPPAFLHAVGLESYAIYGFIGGALVLIYVFVNRGEVSHPAIMFGTDSGGRTNVLGCYPAEILSMTLFAVLLYELTTVFLWDELYRV
jgi:hypothetical protein